MNFVTSVFKKYINKNDTKQSSQHIPPETAKCTNNVEVGKSNGIKNTATSQSPAQNHPRIFEEDEPFEDAQTNFQMAIKEPQIGGPTIEFRKSSSIQPDSLNTSMIDSLEIAIPETVASINNLEDSIEKSEKDFFKSNEDFEEYKSLSPLVLDPHLVSFLTPVSLNDILKPKKCESLQSSLEVLITQVNKTLAIDDGMRTKEIVAPMTNSDEKSQDITQEKIEASGPQSLDDLLNKLATCSLKDKTNEISEKIIKKIGTIETVILDDLNRSLEVQSQPRSSSQELILHNTAEIIKESEIQINAIEKQEMQNFEAPKHVNNDSANTIRVFFEQNQKEEFIEKKPNKPKDIKLKANNQDTYMDQITNDFVKLESSKCDVMFGKSKIVITEDKENSNKDMAIEKGERKQPVPDQKTILEISPDNILDKIERAQYIESKKTQEKVEKICGVSGNQTNEKNYNRIHSSINRDSTEDDLQDLNVAIYKRQETLEFERLEQQFAEKSNAQKSEDKDILGVTSDTETKYEKVEREVSKNLKHSINGIINDIIEESQHKVIKKLALDELERSKPKQIVVPHKKLEQQLTEYSSEEENKTKRNDIIEKLVADCISPHTEVQRDQEGTLDFNKHLDEISFKNKRENILRDIYTRNTEEGKLIKEGLMEPSKFNLPAKSSYSIQENPQCKKLERDVNLSKVNDILEELVAESEGNIIESSQNNNINLIQAAQVDQHGIYKRQETLEFEKLEKNIEDSSCHQKVNNFEEIVTKCCPRLETMEFQNICFENTINESQLSTDVDFNKSLQENSDTVQEKNNQVSLKMSISSDAEDDKDKITKVNSVDEIKAEDLHVVRKVQGDQYGVCKRQEMQEFEKLEQKLEDYSVNKKTDKIAGKSCPLSYNNHNEAGNVLNQENILFINQKSFENAVKNNKGDHPSMPFSHTKVNINEKDLLNDVLIDSIPNPQIESYINISQLINSSSKPKQDSPRKFLNKVEVRPNIRHKSKSSVSIDLVKPTEQNAQNDELGSEINILKEHLHCMKKMNRNRKPDLEIKNNKDIIEIYRKLLEEYESHIAQQTKDLEQLKIESEMNIRHFTNTEMAFSDVFEKYEKAKGVIAAYKRNEETLSENLKNAGEQLYQLEAKCSTMKKQSMEYIQRANEQIEQEKRKYNMDIGKLHAQVKRLEIKASSLEVALKQKTDECQALAALCDDITGRSIS
ncbi:uncharacterized protein LOC126742577 isoform X2 [Anthonomus grandis grandis]|uniref:uncharacterized protein LOC126742577 isoform X2 n=1 Tax=Anthonomus grandis grandis TaxID=2921223 RepID=UPI002165A4D2|nr:uncharacterized protein LOC126742577 isoform X2 [Anthonomus grandis grandis]